VRDLSPVIYFFNFGALPNFFTLHDIVFNHENALIVLRGSDMHMGPCFQASEQDSLFQDQEQDPELQDKD